MTWRAEQINDLAGLFGLNEMSKAAWSLCELLDLCSDGHANERSAIASHIRSLELLRAGDQVPEEERLAVLNGLSAVLDHFRNEAHPVS